MRPETDAGQGANPLLTYTYCLLIELAGGAVEPDIGLRPMRSNPGTSILQSSALPGWVVAPTEMTCVPAAGDPVVPSPGPELPEAATTVVPVSAALLAATAVGVSGPPPPPRLMLMTFATGFGWPVRVNGE